MTVMGRWYIVHPTNLMVVRQTSACSTTVHSTHFLAVGSMVLTKNDGALQVTLLQLYLPTSGFPI